MLGEPHGEGSSRSSRRWTLFVKRRTWASSVVDPSVSRYLGPLEAEVMHLLWTVPEVSVRQVAEHLNTARPEHPLAYTTVMTVMNRLEEKGLLEHTVRGKAYGYQAKRSQAAFLARLASDRVTAVIEEFGELALSEFLNRLEDLDPDQLRRLAGVARERGPEGPAECDA